MKKIVIILAAIIVILVAAYFLIPSQDSETVPLPSSFTSEVFEFSCDNDAKFTIQYNDASEYSLLSLSGVQYTLSRVVSASGARYTDEEAGVEFWEHQDEALVKLPGMDRPMTCMPFEESTPVIVTDPDNQEGIPNLLRIESPTSGTSVGNPLLVSGEARGYWFFEASAPVVVTDWDGRIIGQGFMTADGDWMTEDFVPFSGSIEYDLPVDIYSATGTVIFQKDNPSGLPENDAAYEVLVILQRQS